MEFHEELFGYVDHMVDKVLSVPTRDGDEEWRRSRHSRKRISISKEESLDSCTVMKWENSKNKSQICYNCSDNCTLWSLSTLLAQTIPYHETWRQWDAANVPLFVYRRQPLRNSHRLCILDGGWREDSLRRATRISEFNRVALNDNRMLKTDRNIRC